MNIKITYNWLLEYLDTDANPYDIQKYLSLSGPSVEKVEKVDDDYVFDIEITSNRIDTASIIGIAQECVAILPQFGKKAELKFNPLDEYRFSRIPDGGTDCLKVKITSPKLCSRFAMIVLSDLEIRSAPQFIKERLVLCGIKSINNVVDISNYLMLSLGQPTHIFDFNKIKNLTMIMRESLKGEKITTLDEKEITLPGGDIVIEDGEGKLIDLCGIMGGLNSSISEKTKNVILFVQTYNKQLIRKTSMTTGQRTVAATYFEKGLDEERVETTLTYGVELLKQYAGGKIASKLYDIYPHPYKQKRISLKTDDLNRLIGVDIKKEILEKIISRLNFELTSFKGNSMTVTVPSYRQYDINIKEDLVEEIARIYGYHNLPNNLPPPAYVKQPKEMENLFKIQSKIKYFLKHAGLNESTNYSMISMEMIESLDLKVTDHLKLSNSISSDIEYLRTSLIPSLIRNIKSNEGKRDALRFFEIAKVYLPKKLSLPGEKYKLAIAINTEFGDLKGLIEILLAELNIDNYEIKKGKNSLMNPSVQGEIYVNGESLGSFGVLKSKYRIKNQLENDVYLAEFDLDILIKNYRLVAPYKPINPFAVIKLDLTFATINKMPFAVFRQKAFKTSKLLQKIELIGIYENKVSLRFFFSSTVRNINQEEAEKELEKFKALVLG